MNPTRATTLRTFLRTITQLLVNRQYLELERLSNGNRLSASEMANAVAEYGRTLVMPTDEEFSPDIVSVKESVYPKWSVVIPLRTVEEGASDLSLQLIVSQTNSTEFELGISDLHVL